MKNKSWLCFPMVLGINKILLFSFEFPFLRALLVDPSMILPLAYISTRVVDLDL